MFKATAEPSAALGAGSTHPRRQAPGAHVARPPGRGPPARGGVVLFIKLILALFRHISQHLVFTPFSVCQAHVKKRAIVCQFHS